MPLRAHRYDDPANPHTCLNCGAKLSGPYCSQCSQQDLDYHRSFLHLAHEVVENLFHFDGKFLASVAVLLARPGRLTVEFNAGRRQSQVPPLRFYLFVSVLFFFGVHLLHHGHLFEFDRRHTDEIVRRVQTGMGVAEQLDGKLTPAQKLALQAQLTAAAETAGPEIDRETIARLVAAVRAGAAPGVARPAPGGSMTFNRDSALGRTLADKVATGELAPTAIIDEVEHRVPTALVLGMPVLALLLKFFYLRSGRYYIEHLIFSLHLHTWLFLALMVGDGWLELAALGPRWLGLLGAGAFALWMPGYVFAAFRAVYRESAGRTAVKLLGLAFTYSAALLGVVALIFGWTLMWLVWE